MLVAASFEQRDVGVAAALVLGGDIRAPVQFPAVSRTYIGFKYGSRGPDASIRRTSTAYRNSQSYLGPVSMRETSGNCNNARIPPPSTSRRGSGAARADPRLRRTRANLWQVQPSADAYTPSCGGMHAPSRPAPRETTARGAICGTICRRLPQMGPRAVISASPRGRHPAKPPHVGRSVPGTAIGWHRSALVRWNRGVGGMSGGVSRRPSPPSVRDYSSM